MAYEPLHHKYRPQTFAQLVGQEAIATTLSNALEQRRIAPAYLFSGPRGTGKTSSARILAKSLNCLNSENPTPSPCGECEVCRAIANGSALDVIEIDAASNTGVDNIRELIERSQFAPVQCRYKVYVIDECLTGETLVTTSQGFSRIDNPNLKGQDVLSFCEETGIWEYKKVLRWLDQGTKQTLTIQTQNQKIRCTENHLIRTEQGWIQAAKINAGSKILSPLQQKEWTTNFEIVESVVWGDAELVYDIEVEDNHNFVANGLLVHNCHMLSVAAFNALLKTLEEPPNHVVFVLATTDPQRVLPTIISRCQRFDYRRIPLDAMVGHLQKIAQIENIDIPLESVTLIAQIANGGLRDAESLLDQLSLLSGEITAEKVWDLVGAVPERDLLTLIQMICSNNPEAVIHQCRNLLNRGREPLVVLQNLASFYLNLLIAKTAPQRGDLIAVTQPTWQALCEEAKSWQIELILKGQQHLKDSEYQLKNTTQPRLWLEITLLGLLPAALGTVQVQNTVNLGETIGTNLGAIATSPTPQTPVTPQTPPKVEPVHPFGETPAVEVKPQEPATPIPAPVPVVTPEPSPEPTFSQTNGNGFQPSVTEISVAPTPAPIPEPQPEPVPTPPRETTSSPTISALEREQLWQQVLSVPAPKTTTAFFKQQGSLLQFNGNVAVIQVKTPVLLKLAKSKDRPRNLEIAFSKVCGSSIKVSFKVGEEEDGEMDFMGSSAVKSAPVSAPPSAYKPVVSTPPNHEVHPFDDVPVASPTTVAPIPTPQPQPMQGRSPVVVTPTPTPLPPTESPVIAEEGAEILESGSTQDVTRQFAELFGGEVIELAHLMPDEVDNGENLESTIAIATPEPTPEPIPTIQGRTPVTTSIDDDIPF